MFFRPSFRGVAYLASANFMARAIIFLHEFLQSLFLHEMILLYGAHLDSQIMLFFQAVFMIPVFLLGCLVFVGIEKESFNLVLYPTLMLLFVVLLRYGAELALLIIHWSDHKFDQAPGVIYFLVVDLICIVMLLLYVYFSLTSAPIPPTPPVPHFIEAPELSVNKTESLEEDETLLKLRKKRKKPPAPPPEGCEVPSPPPRPPPSPKFNYALRRNIGHLSQDSPERGLLDELNKQRLRNSQILPEESEDEEQPQKVFVKTQSLKVYETEPKRRSLLIETDLDAEDNLEPDKPSAGEPELTEVKDVSEVKDAEATVAKPPEVEEEAEESEWEYEYEDEEEPEEAGSVTVTLPRPPKVIDAEVKVQDHVPKEVEITVEKAEGTEGTEEVNVLIAGTSKSFKTTAV